MRKKEIDKLKSRLPWYSIPILMAILGAVSVVLMFAVYFFNDRGVVFYSIIFSWLVILIIAGLEIGRLEKLRKKIQDEHEKYIEDLKKNK